MHASGFTASSPQDVSDARVAITTKNALKRISAILLNCYNCDLQQPKHYQGCKCTKKELQLRNFIMPALRHLLAATSLPKLFHQGNPRLQLQETAC
jgi:hypothetical protein